MFAGDPEAVESIAGAQAYVACAVAAIGNGALNSAGVEFAQAKSEPVAISADGDEAYAAQLTAARTVHGQSLPSVMQYTLVIVRKGRVVYEITSRGIGEPVETDDMSAFAEGAASQIRQK